MKRIKAACTCQTLHFTLKEGMKYDDVVYLVRQKAAHYKIRLGHGHIQYNILEGLS